MKIECKINGKSYPVEVGKKILDVIKELMPNEYKKYIVAKVNDTLVDLTTTITNETKEIELLTFDEAKDVFWHSSAHVMAAAIMRLFPEAKLTIGPPIEQGFFYDIFYERPFTPEDLEKIEKEMRKIVSEDVPFVRKEISYEEAKEMFKDNKFKLEIIEENKDNVLSVYYLGDFVDLCRGPHVPSSGYVKAFKLTKLSGAYWRGDAKREQLQRIYGISFPTKEQLKQYLEWLDEVKRRDHRKLARELELFSFHEEGPGFPFYLPKGMVLFEQLLKLWRKLHRKAGYVEIKTPIMLSKELWIRSGHWENYREFMYTTKIDDKEFAIKPMNCPGGILVYKEKVHSYKEFPLRVAEIGLVHRHELSGVTTGLFRVRALHQDDAHIFLRPNQIKDEVSNILELVDKIYSIFGLTYHLELSTRPEKYIGSIETWNHAEQSLKEALESTGKSYEINPGDGAFYGPKIDVHIKDSLGRTWQCATIQLDMNLPERFDLTYVEEDGSLQRPVMLHRTIYGSFERFMGILIEHYAGKFPLWLSPVQVKILPIADRHISYAKELKEFLEDHEIRVEVNNRAETLNKKIRQAQLEKVNYIVVVGDREMQEGKVNVRTRDGDVLGAMTKNEFLTKLLREIEEYK